MLAISTYLITFATEVFYLLLILVSEFSFEHRNSYTSLDFDLSFEVSFQVAKRYLSFIEMPFWVALSIFVNAYQVFLVSCPMQVM